MRTKSIKNAVQSGLGAAFVSVSAIAKELELGILHWSRIEDVTIKRMLSISVSCFARKYLAFKTFNFYLNSFVLFVELIRL